MTSVRRVVARLVRRVRRPRPWRLPVPGPPDDTDWAEACAAGRAVVYERLRRALTANTVSGAAAEGFAALGLAGAAVEALLDGLDGPDRAAAVAGLYARLMGVADREILVAMIERTARQGLAAARADAAGPGSHLAWRWAYATSAAAVAFERTADGRFAVVLADAAAPVPGMRDAVAGRMDECRGRVGGGWSSGSVLPGRITTNVTLAGRIAEPLAHLARLAGGNAMLGGVAPEAAAAARAAIEDFDDRFVAVGDAGFYPVACGDRPEPLNHLAAFGAALLRLHDLTGDRHLLDRAEALARWFTIATHRDRSGNLVWRYDPAPPRDPRGRGPEHVWKAQVTIHFVVLAVNRGLLEGVVLEEVRRTLLANVFRPEGLAATIEPDREPMTAYRGLRGGASSALPLNELGGQVLEAVEDLVSSDPGLGGWFRRPHGLVAYAQRVR